MSSGGKWSEAIGGRALRALLLLGSALLFQGSAAAAAAGELPRLLERVSWRSPRECPDRGALLRELEPLLRGRVLRAAPELDLRIVVSRTGAHQATPRGHYRARLTILEGSRSSARDLEAPTCQGVMRAAALATSLALTSPDGPAPHPEVTRSAAHTPAELQTKPLTEAATEARSTSTGEQPSNTEPSLQALPSKEEPLPPPASAQQRRPRNVPRRAGRLALASRLDLMVDFGSLPRSAAGLRLSGEASTAGWEVHGLGLWLPTITAALGGNEQAHFDLWAAGLGVCRRMAGEFTTFKLCPHLELGRLVASGAGLEQATRYSNGWAAPGATLALESPLTRQVRWSARAEILRPLNRKHYAINQDQVIHTTPAWLPRLALGITYCL